MAMSDLIGSSPKFRALLEEINMRDPFGLCLES
jgi:hypothetical protein